MKTKETRKNRIKELEEKLFRLKYYKNKHIDKGRVLNPSAVKILNGEIKNVKQGIKINKMRVA